MVGASRPLARIAWRNVRKHWRHSLGAMLSIVVGFVAIGLFEGYISELDRVQGDWYFYRGMLGHVVIEQRGASGSEGREDPWTYSLDRDEQQFVDSWQAPAPKKSDGQVSDRAVIEDVPFGCVDCSA